MAAAVATVSQIPAGKGVGQGNARSWKLQWVLEVRSKRSGDLGRKRGGSSARGLQWWAAERLCRQEEEDDHK
jgi:hypothetical protein